MSQFTQQEADELGLSLEILNQWKKVMDELWSFLTGFAENNRLVKVESIDNSIRYQMADANVFLISINFLNKKLLELDIKIEGNDEFHCRISQIDKFDRESLIRTVANILTGANSIS